MFIAGSTAATRCCRALQTEDENARKHQQLSSRTLLTGRILSQITGNRQPRSRRVVAFHPPQDALPLGSTLRSPGPGFGSAAHGVGGMMTAVLAATCTAPTSSSSSSSLPHAMGVAVDNPSLPALSAVPPLFPPTASTGTTGAGGAAGHKGSSHADNFDSATLTGSCLAGLRDFFHDLRPEQRHVGNLWRQWLAQGKPGLAMGWSRCGCNGGLRADRTLYGHRTIDSTAPGRKAHVQFALTNTFLRLIATVPPGVYVTQFAPLAITACVLRCVVGAGWGGRPLLPLVSGRQAVRRSGPHSGRQRSELCALRRVRCAARRAGGAVGDSAGAAAAEQYGDGGRRRTVSADASRGGGGGRGGRRWQGRARGRG